MLKSASYSASLALLCLSLSQVPATAQTYPSKTVRLIVGAAPGGNPDILARALAQKLSESLGKAFVVENLPGGGGVVAAQNVVNAAADGHVLMLGDSGALAINVATTPGLTYQPLRDFTPITALATVPTVLVLHPSVPAKDLKSFISLAKQGPKRINYGSPGVGSVHHLTMAVFAARAGIELEHIAYRGGTAMVAAVLQGEVQAGWSGIPNVLEPTKLGTLRAIAASTIERQKTMPDVPTAHELGFKGFDIATMMGLQGPAGVPKEVVAKLQKAVAEAMRQPDMVERMDSLGMSPAEEGTESYVQFMKDDIARYAKAAQESGISIK